MNFADILAMAIHNLWQRRLRTLMNQTGVVIGCIVLLMTAAGASGVRLAFQALFDASEFARQIEVYQSWGSQQPVPDGAVAVDGDMAEDRRERLQELLEHEWRSKNLEPNRFRITRETARQFEKLAHVQAVVPQVHVGCKAHMADGGRIAMSRQDGVEDKAVPAGLTGAGMATASMKRSLVAGEPLATDDREGVLVDEFLAYKLGFRSDDELSQMLGQKLTIEITVEGLMSHLFRMFAGRSQQGLPDSLVQQKQFLVAFSGLLADLDKTSLTEQQKAMLTDLMTMPQENRPAPADLNVTRTFVVRGIYRRGANESLSRIFGQQLMGERFSLQVHRDVAAGLYFQDPNRQDFNSVVVLVDSTSHLEEVTAKLTEVGASHFSSLQIIDSINNQIDRKSWLVYGLAAAILLTAAIGISNTLIISVMERTPEFGIMKALGAKDRDLVLLMMVEGAVLGVFGAVCAVLISWGLSYVVQIFLRWYLEYETNGAITGDLMQFSALPIVLTFVISVLVCSAASVAPAIRAARLDPVVAMQRT